MLEPVTGLPDGTIGFRATGQLTGDDYRQVLVPDLEEALMDHQKVRLFYEIGPGYTGFDADASWEDLKVGMSHLTAFERVAAVTDIEWMRDAVKALGFMTPVDIRVFSLADEDAARRWLIS